MLNYWSPKMSSGLPKMGTSCFLINREVMALLTLLGGFNILKKMKALLETFLWSSIVTATRTIQFPQKSCTLGIRRTQIKEEADNLLCHKTRRAFGTRGKREP